ncbi:MAG: Gfo/Idh/MocA family oxidoreductase [Kiritimatiellae bacterium]|nr:Gfo/Idh/MocA family oxidoreductase [Kiritimatiellia bacterium]
MTPKTMFVNRREFLALAGAACFNIGNAATLPRAVGKGRRIRMALVGCGNRGTNFLLQEMVQEQVVALADPNAKNLEAVLAKLRNLDPSCDTSKVKTFRDYREMFEKASGEIDAVVVATNNNHHALPALMAMRRGIHAYVEKPLANTLEEIHALRDAAKKYGVVTQAGHQGHSAHGIRLAAEYMAAGAFGEVKEVWCWHGAMQARPSCPPRVAPPSWIDWDVWCGGSPVCGWYAADEVFPELSRHDWHSWIDYGNGTVGNWGAHIFDTPMFMLGLDKTPPVSVEAKEIALGAEGGWPMRTHVEFTFPARGKAPPVKLHWYDGIRDGVPFKRPYYEGFYGKISRRQDQFLPPELVEEEKLYCAGKKGASFGGMGAMIRIDGGVVTFGGWGAGPRFWPNGLHKKFPKPPQLFERVTSHFGSFCDAIRKGKKASTDFDYGAPLADLTALVNVAQRAGCKKLIWDGNRFTNDAEANSYVARKYRSGWSLA